MQHMSEEIVTDTVQRAKSHVLEHAFAWLSPVMQMQKCLNRLADTDMLANQAFLD